MLRRHQQFYYQVLQIIDAFVLAGMLCLAHFIRSSLPHLSWGEIGSVGPLEGYLWLLGIILPAGPLLLELQGFYRLDLPPGIGIVAGRIIRGILALWFLLLAVIVFLRIPNEAISRAVLLLFVPLAIAAMLLRDVFFRRWYLRRNRSSKAQRNVLLCGSMAQRARWREGFQLLPSRQLAICEELDLAASSIGEFILTLHRENIEIVLFELDHSRLAETNQAIKACEAEGIEAWVTADFIHTVLARPQFDELLGRPLFIFRTTPDASWPLLLKSLIDRTGAFFILLLFSPILIAVAVAILISSGRPIFFSQMRSGQHGKPFRMYKFRTMVTQAEQGQAELKAFNQMDGPVFKMANDPRITAIGRWLRRYSLDEFPQLLNVLAGDMSLVGPRPLPVSETERFTDYAQRRRLSVKPGLTCLWQVGGRNDIRDFSDWVRLDLEYIDHWSLFLDFRILLKTIPVVLFGRGAR